MRLEFKEEENKRLWRAQEGMWRSPPALPTKIREAALNQPWLSLSPPQLQMIAEVLCAEGGSFLEHQHAPQL